MAQAVGYDRMSAPGPALPSDAEVFRFPESLFWLLIGGSLFFLGMLVSSLVWRATDPREATLTVVLISIVVSGAGAVVCLRSFFGLRDRVAVSSDGIWYLPREGEPTFIAWSKVASVKALDIRNRLVLSDASGSRKIKLWYQLENFARLREFVLSHTEAARRRAPFPSVFHRNLANQGSELVLCALCLLSAGITFLLGLPGTAIISAAFAIVLFAMFALEPAWVEIRRDAVVIESFARQGIIPFNAISDVVLAEVHQLGYVWESVTIKRLHGRPVRLFTFLEGSVALHDALHSAWLSARAGN